MSDTTPDTTETPTPATEPATGKRRVSLPLSAVLTATALVALTAASITTTALWLSGRAELRDRDAAAADDRHAEQVAMDYAVGASQIDYRDTKSWFDRLKSGTATDLAAKFDATAPQLEQILLPLQWSSKATPIRAVVGSEQDGVYKVDAFLTVNSTSVQTPQGGSTTVTYSVTIDRKSGWKITSVGGGLDGAVTAK